MSKQFNTFGGFHAGGSQYGKRPYHKKDEKEKAYHSALKDERVARMSSKTKAIHKRLDEENSHDERMERRKNLLGSIRRGE